MTITHSTAYSWNRPVMGHPKYSGPTRFAFNCGNTNQFFVVLKFPEGLWTRQELLLIAGAARMLNETSTGLLDFAAYADKLVHATFEPSPQRRNQMMIRCHGSKADVLFHTIVLHL